MVTAKLVNYVVFDAPGSVVRAWGRDFTVQTNGDAICEMSVETADAEAKAGRVVVIERPKPAKSTSQEFSNDPSDYFGCESAELLRERLRGLSRTNLEIFAKKFLNLDIPGGMGKESTTTAIMNATEAIAAKKGE